MDAGASAAAVAADPPQAFKAAKGWCHRRRASLVHTRMRGEMASADVDAATSFPARLKEIMRDLDVREEEVYNCDETLLFPRLRSQYGVCPMQAAREIRGIKSDKSRIGILVTTCADGTHFVPPIFANTSLTPRGMTGYRTVQPMLKVAEDGSHFYACTHNGWISRELFAYYVAVVLPASVVTSPRKRALLLVDGCGGGVAMQDGSRVNGG